jgi:hypothetical protein
MKSESDNNHICRPLGKLIIELETQGFRFDVDTYLRLQKVLQDLGHGYTECPGDLKHILCPIIAKSKGEQDRFNQIFDKYYNKIFEEASEKKEQEKSSSKKSKSRFFLNSIIALLLLSIILIYILFIARPSSSFEPEFNVFSIEGLVVKFRNITERKEQLKFRWHFGDNKDSNSTESIVQHVYDKRQKYTVTLEAFDSKSHYGTSSLEIDLLVKHQVKFSFTPTNPKAGDEIMFTITTPVDNIDQFFWDFGDGNTQISSAPSIKYRFRDPKKYRIKLRARFSDGTFASSSQEVEFWGGGFAFQGLPVFLFILLLISAGVIVFFILLIKKCKKKKYSDKKGIEAKPPYFLPFLPQNQYIKTSPEFYEIANNLRKRIKGDKYKLDVFATVKSSIRSCGLPKLVFKQTSRPPEYLILIDKQNKYNQQTKVFEEMINVLEKEDIYIDRFMYNADPCKCWNENFPDGILLSELYDKFPGHRLIIWGDGFHLIEPFRLEISDWVKSLFKGWSERVLFTPVAVENWGNKESLLNEELFVILPADINGHLALLDIMAYPHRSSLESLKGELSDKKQPPNMFKFKNLADLKKYFDNPLLTWLCCLAIYPRTTWEITLAIGKELENHFGGVDLVTHQNLLKLTRIEWLQTGYLPTKTKKELQKYLLHSEPEIMELAHKAVIKILHQTVVPKDSFAFKEKEDYLKIKFKQPNILKDPFYREGILVWLFIEISNIVTQTIPEGSSFYPRLLSIYFFIIVGFIIRVIFKKTKVFQPKRKSLGNHMSDSSQISRQLFVRGVFPVFR